MPIVPVISNPPNVASPLEFVVAVAEVTEAPPGPVAIEAVITTPLVLTGLPLLSSS